MAPSSVGEQLRVVERDGHAGRRQRMRAARRVADERRARHRALVGVDGVVGGDLDVAAVERLDERRAHAGRKVRRVVGADARDDRLFALVHVRRQVDAGARIARADRIDEDRSPRAEEDVPEARLRQRTGFEQRRGGEREQPRALGHLDERADLRVAPVAGDDHRRQRRTLLRHDADDALLIAHQLDDALAEAQLDAGVLEHLLAHRVDEIVMIDGEAERPRSRDLLVGQKRDRLVRRLHDGEAAHVGAAGRVQAARGSRARSSTSTPCGWMSSPLKRGLRPARASSTRILPASVRQRRGHGASRQAAADHDDVIPRRVCRSASPPKATPRPNGAQPCHLAAVCSTVDSEGNGELAGVSAPASGTCRSSGRSGSPTSTSRTCASSTAATSRRPTRARPATTATTSTGSATSCTRPTPTSTSVSTTR